MLKGSKQKGELFRDPMSGPESGPGIDLPDVAFLGRCLSDENRLRIFLCVSQKKKSVSRIVEETGLSQPLVSHHLKELRRALLVTVERRGPFVYYEMADRRVLEIIRSLSALALDLLARRKRF